MSAGYLAPPPVRRPTRTLQVTIAATGVAQRFTASRTIFRALQAWGYKATAEAGNTNNAASVFVGWSETAQTLEIPPGLTASWPGLERKDLSDMWIRGTAGDGLFLEWDGEASSEAS